MITIFKYTCLAISLVFIYLFVALNIVSTRSITMGLLTFFFLYAVFKGKRSNYIQISLIVIFIFLFLLPAIGVLTVLENSVFFPILFFCILYFLFCLDYPPEPSYYEEKKNIMRKIYACFILIISSLLISSIYDSFLSFTIPYSMSFFFYEKILKSKVPSIVSYSFLYMYIFTVIIYLILFWSGFGRVVIVGYLLVPLLLLHHYQYIKINLFYLIFLSPIALLLAQLTRYEEVDTIDKILIGSAGHHLIVTDDIIKMKILENSFNELDFSFFDQLSLLYFNWVPRIFWEAKPLGIGYISLFKMLDGPILDLDYSQSVGFVGENVLYFDKFFIFGVFVCWLILFITVKAFRLISFKYETLAIIFYVNLLSYFWGGMATMGSRLWFMALPILILILLDKIIHAKKNI